MALYIHIQGENWTSNLFEFILRYQLTYCIDFNINAWGLPVEIRQKAKI